MRGKRLRETLVCGREESMHHLAFKIPQPLLERLDLLVAQERERTGYPKTRSDVLRDLVAGAKLAKPKPAVST